MHTQSLLVRVRLALTRAATMGVVVATLSGCGGTGQDIAADLGALGVGGAVGAATGNPAIGIAAGVGARIALDEGYLYGQRHFYGSIQDSIAAAGGRAAVGEVEPWTYEGPLDIGDSRGRVETVRAFGRRLRCKEIIFTVEPLPEPSAPWTESGTRSRPVPAVDLAEQLPANAEILTTTICRSPDGWAWAQARPSASRWGGLQ